MYFMNDPKLKKKLPSLFHISEFIQFVDSYVLLSKKWEVFVLCQCLMYLKFIDRFKVITCKY